MATHLKWVVFQVLGAPGTEEDVEPLQDTRPVAGRPHHQDRQEVGTHVLNACISLLSPQPRVRSRYVNVGLFYLRQLFLATFDFVVHDNSLGANTDYTKLWNELRQQITHLEGGDQPGQGGFGHIAGEYDVGYYGYVVPLGAPSLSSAIELTCYCRYTYSLVFAADMYTTVFKKAPLDPRLGKLYRDKILLPGGSRDEMELLKVSQRQMDSHQARSGH